MHSDEGYPLVDFGAEPVRGVRTLAKSLSMPFAVGATVLSASVGVQASGTSLRDDVQRVGKAWVEASESVTRSRPQFLKAGQLLAIGVPVGRNATGCTSIGVLGSRTTDFVLQSASAAAASKDGPNGPGGGEQSSAGVAMVSRCGESQVDLESLVVRMKSPMGAVEVLIARGREPAPTFEDVLPERAAGIVVQPTRPGRPSAVAPHAGRVETARRLIQEMGGVIVEQRELRSVPSGGASLRLPLDPGCHRFVVSTVNPPERESYSDDTDLELRLPDGRVARDRSMATDAMVDVCVAERVTDAMAVVSGAVRSRVFTLLHGSWPIPDAIPSDWSLHARAASAQVLLGRRWPTLPSEPVWEGIGVGGITELSVPVVPGTCYVAIIAGIRGGENRSLLLRSRVGPRFAMDYGPRDVNGAMVSFCSGAERTARIDVEAYGSRNTWTAALWAISTVPLGTTGDLQ